MTDIDKAIELAKAEVLPFESPVTLRANGGGNGANTGLYCLPAYCIVGNTIDRADETGGNGTGASRKPVIH